MTTLTPDPRKETKILEIKVLSNWLSEWKGTGVVVNDEPYITNNRWMVVIDNFRWKVRSIIVDWKKVTIPSDTIIEWGSRVLLANCVLSRSRVDLILVLKSDEFLKSNKTSSPLFFNHVQWVLIQSLIPMGLRYDAKAVDRADIAYRDQYAEVPTL